MTPLTKSWFFFDTPGCLTSQVYIKWISSRTKGPNTLCHPRYTISLQMFFLDLSRGLSLFNLHREYSMSILRGCLLPVSLRRPFGNPAGPLSSEYRFWKKVSRSLHGLLPFQMCFFFYIQLHPRYRLNPCPRPRSARSIISWRAYPDVDS